MSDNNSPMGDIIAGIAVSQGVILDLLMDTGVITPVQAYTHLTKEIERMKSAGKSAEIMMCTERLLTRMTDAWPDLHQTVSERS